MVFFYVGMVLCFRLLMIGLCNRWDNGKIYTQIKSDGVMKSCKKIDKSGLTK